MATATSGAPATATPKTTSRSKKTSWGWWIGGGIAALLLLIFLVALFSGSGKRADFSEQAKLACSEMTSEAGFGLVPDVSTGDCRTVTVNGPKRAHSTKRCGLGALPSQGEALVPSGTGGCDIYLIVAELSYCRNMVADSGFGLVPSPTGDRCEMVPVSGLVGHSPRLCGESLPPAGTAYVQSVGGGCDFYGVVNSRAAQPQVVDTGMVQSRQTVSNLPSCHFHSRAEAVQACEAVHGQWLQGTGNTGHCSVNNCR